MPRIPKHYRDSHTQFETRNRYLPELERRTQGCFWKSPDIKIVQPPIFYPGTQYTQIVFLSVSSVTKI